MTTELITIIGAVIVAALGSPVVVLYAKQYFERKTKTMTINNRINNDKIMLEKLYEILYTTCADRAFIFQLHPESNPTYMSCTHEVVKTGVSKEIHNLQGLLLSEWNIFLMKLKDDGFVLIDFVNELSENDIKLQTLLKNKGVKSSYKKTIFNNNKQIIGFIGVEFCSDIKKISGETIQLLSEQSVYLEKYLGEYKHV